MMLLYSFRLIAIGGLSLSVCFILVRCLTDSNNLFVDLINRLNDCLNHCSSPSLKILLCTVVRRLVIRLQCLVNAC